MAKDRHIRVTGQRKRKPDYRKLSAALLAYVAAQAEADAETQQERKSQPSPKKPGRQL
jgi:hypothetical protein